MTNQAGGYYLKTRVSGANTGRVYFRDENRPAGQEETEDFQIRLTDVGTIRPGDDIQLRFGVSGFPQFDTEVPDGDFMAVYNKKLLWRAQLYIDEGANDWNNLNPWDDPVNNDWYVSQANGADVNGGQIMDNIPCEVIIRVSSAQAGKKKCEV
jgi:hypothetical protein